VLNRRRSALDLAAEVAHGEGRVIVADDRALDFLTERVRRQQLRLD